MQAGSSASRIPQSLGDTVDDFTLRDLSGGERRLSEFLRARRGAVVIFWSGICSHCVRYDAYLNGFSTRHSELGLVAVASRQGETTDQIRGSVAQRALTFPLLLDPAAAVAARWSTQQTPRVFLIDADRVLRYRGAIDNYKYPDDPEYVAYLEPAIGEFLAGLPIGRADTPSFGCAIQSVYYVLPEAYERYLGKHPESTHRLARSRRRLDEWRSAWDTTVARGPGRTEVRGGGERSASQWPGVPRRSDGGFCGPCVPNCPSTPWDAAELARAAPDVLESARKSFGYPIGELHGRGCCHWRCLWRLRGSAHRLYCGGWQLSRPSGRVKQ